MTPWQPNAGHRPQPTHADAPAIHKVFVRLRGGMEPVDPWPVDTGRHETTRWTLEGGAFDIVEWRLG